MSRTTLKDIALALNISVSTVSKALSDSYEISEATKKMVQEYAKKHNFHPNKLARSLKIGKSNTIGVIVSNISNTFVSQILDGIQIASQQTVYDVIFMQSREDERIEKNCIDVLRMRGIDGLMISPVSSDSNIEELKALIKSQIPVVIFDRINHQLDTFKVGVNNFQGSYNATKHLIEKGKKNILHITGKNLGVAAERLNGFKSALSDAGIPFDTRHYIECSFNNTTDIDETIREILRKEYLEHKNIDAIFGATDIITTRTLGILAELQIQVPSEVAVIGFSNTQIAASLNPALSTVVQPATEIGELATNKLIATINQTRPIHEFETIELPTQLIIRKSSL